MPKACMIRIDEDLLHRFLAIQPAYGDLSHFVRFSMEEFIRLWGDRPTPQQVAAEAVANVFHKFG